MKNPLITIIIPTYNAALTIKKCIGSIVNQSYKNIEVLVVDGVSGDDTISYMRDFEKEYSFIKIVSEVDKGIYDAMNKGIKLANGLWVYFLGSDDFLFNDMVLENVANVIANDNAVQVIYGKVYSERINGEYGAEFYQKKILKYNICHQAIFFRKDVFNIIGDYDLKYKAHADWDHNLKWVLNDRIKCKYSNLLIAWYADGGFSAKVGDKVFYRDLPLNYIRYGYSILSFRRKLSILVYQFFKSIKRLDFKKTKNVIQHFRFLSK